MNHKAYTHICVLIALFTITVLVAGCVERSSDEGEKAEPTYPQNEAYEQQAPDSYIAARDFLFNGFFENDGLGGYGYLLFSSRPNSETETRYQRVCNAFTSSINLNSDFPDSTAYQQIVTYWPLQSKPNSTSELESCSWLVDNYDYPKAEIILSYISMNHVNGPILVAWQTPFNPGSMGRDYLVFNLSNFANNDIHRAISVWKGQTIKGPEDWEEGFLYARTKEELRNFIQQYGNSIFSIVTGGG